MSNNSIRSEKYITCKKIPFLKEELKKFLLELRNEIKANEKLNQTQQSILESLLLLEKDALKDDLNELAELKENDIIKKIINFNIYGNIRKFLLSNQISSNVIWQDDIYSEDKSPFKAYYGCKNVLQIVLSNAENPKTKITVFQMKYSEPIRNEKKEELIEILKKNYPDDYKCKNEIYELKYPINVDSKKLIDNINILQSRNIQNQYIPYDGNIIYELLKNEYQLIENDEEIITMTGTKITGNQKIETLSPHAEFNKTTIYY